MKNQTITKQIPLFIFCIFLSSCGGGGSGSDDDIQLPPVEPPPSLTAVTNYQLADTEALLTEVTDQLQGLAIEDFFEQAYQITQSRNHENALSDGNFDGLTPDNVNLLNISDEFAQQTAEIEAHILSLLLSYDRTLLSNQNQLSFDVYQAHLENQGKWFEFKDYNFPATYGFFGWPGNTESFFTQVFTINNKAQADIYLALLNQVGRRFEQVEGLLDARAESGIIEPAITLGFSQQNVANVANQSAMNTSFYQAFNEQVSTLDAISEDDKQTLNTLLIEIINQRVLPAYQSLSSKMLSLTEQAPDNIGFGQFEGGEAFYQFTLSFFTSGTLTAEQIHQLGKQELVRIRAEMDELFDLLNYDTNLSLSQLFSQAELAAGTIPANEAKAFYEDLIAKAYVEIPQAFSVLPEQEVIVVGGETGGYYISGSDDGSRPGAFYANTTFDLPYTTMPTLAYHEAVPGHHLQIALANELNLPTFQRKTNFTSFVEGWALYAERLAKDLGWYDGDIYGDLGRLQYEAMRAARLVIDTGIHAKGWTYEQADQYHKEHVGFAGSIARYSVWPGQATAYMTGMLKILELREKAQTQLGDLYDLKEFHAETIGHGSMPLTLLEGIIDDYITNKLAKKQ